MKILDFGCGNNKTKGAIGLDKRTNSQADIIHDFDKFPYPFDDNEFDIIICNNSLEHVKYLEKTLLEFWR